MARNGAPTTGDDIVALREGIEQRQEIREYLSAELGENPEDYAAEQQFAGLEGEPAADGNERGSRGGDDE